ncbi:MAG: electron transport complex subunit RsxC [Candidatus Kapabacteria bacterium]|nr:electron transport complex subunit RsxC [Candidatus Kapabacteria bacterium]
MSFFSINKSFKGGVHPDEHKDLTENSAFELMPYPTEVVLPLSQHIGKPSKVLVKKRDLVKSGQVIAEPDGFISSIIHSPITGKIKDIGKTASVGGRPQEAVTIVAEGEDEVVFMEPLDADSITAELIIERVKEAGIVGQGGAAFPTYVKLMPPKDKNIECIIINGAECEPYLTRDYRYMVERTQDLIIGIKLIMRALGVKRGIIGIEDNKPEAIKMLKEATSHHSEIKVEVLKTKYPQGAEKMLIKVAVNKEVPPGKLPLDVGVVIQNIRTAISVFDAVVKGEPQITAALTVSGFGIKTPKNLIVRVGTTIQQVLDYCGGTNEDARKVIVGGPMMGVAQYDMSAPVQKATSGLLVLTEPEMKHSQETNCLRCGACVDVCALNLIPKDLAKFSKAGKWDEAEALGVTVCMECGTCSYNCPANIPLVQWIRLGKQRVINIQRSKQNVS